MQRRVVLAGLCLLMFLVTPVAVTVTAQGADPSLPDVAAGWATNAAGGPADLNAADAPVAGLAGVTGLGTTQDTIPGGPGDGVTQPYRHLGPQQLFASPQHMDEPGEHLERTFLSFMHDQGLVETPVGLHSELDGAGPRDAGDEDEDEEYQPNRPERPPPPHREIRLQKVACDVDGDSVIDTIGNENLFGTAAGRLKAVSGATGETVWRREQMVGPHSLVLPPFSSDLPTGTKGVDTREHGQPQPLGATNAQMGSDLDGDGVCDVVAVDFKYGSGFGVPFTCIGEVEYTLHVRGISGATGEDIWHSQIPGAWNFAVECYATGDYLRYSYKDFPTGFLAYEAPSGPKVLVTTMDLEMVYLCDPSCDPFYTEQTMFYVSATTINRLRLLDGTDGSQVWTRDLIEPDDGRTNIAWISGAADIAGDEEPEMLLHHLTITNPRGEENRDPITGEPLYRYARGMRMTAIQGEVDAAGATLWSTKVLDPLQVQTRANSEEHEETLVWTYGSITGDLSGDGKPTPVASYIVIEESLSGTASGRFRTYFNPLAGETGEKLWGDKGVRKQGWGFMESIHEDERAEPRAAIGMVDYPTAPPPGGRFPPKFVRLEAVEGHNGATAWGYERLFAQNSFVIYNTALAQFKSVLAPHDWSGDGWRDLVTPSQYVAAQGNSQILLAASSHTYDILAARDGHTLRTFPAWGPDGRVLDCGTAGNEYLTVVAGHPRRIDVTRFDVHSGEQVWRKAVWNNPAPRAAVSGTEVMGLSTACADDDTGRTQLSINMIAASYMRGIEVIAVNGFLAENETHAATWLDPHLRGAPAMSSIFEPFVPPVQLSLQERLDEVAVGAGLGVFSALGLLVVRRRGPSATAIAAVAVVALLAGSGALAPLASALPTAQLDPLGLHGADDGGTDGSGASAPAATVDEAAALPEHVPETGPPVDPGPLSDLPSTVSELLPGQTGGVTMPATPYLRFLSALGDLEREDAWSPQAHVGLVQQYMHAVGFNAPASEPDEDEEEPAPERPDRFEEDTTVSFTYPVGDADGDGVDDFAMDEWCVDRDACTPPQGGPADYYLDFVGAPGRGSFCGPPHHLWVVSGRDGHVIWNRSMDNPAMQYKCGVSFVVDTLPLSDGGTGVLVYTYNITRVSVVPAVIEHTFDLIDGRDGSLLWRVEELGYYAGITVAFSYERAENLLINPITQVPGRGGIQPVDAATTAPALFLQGRGFDATGVSTLFTPPGMNGPLVFVTAYKPNEWAARIDIDNGTTDWRRDTFQAKVGRNELPVALDGWPFAPQSRYYMPEIVLDRYWEHRPCCFDNTGDGEPELTYRVYEWTDTPLYNPEGPEFPLMDGRLAVLDGVTGETLYDQYVVEDNPVPFQLLTQAVGDADGDGAHDILLHVRHVDYDYKHTLSMRSGPDGSEVWHVDSPRELRVYVMGDATDDGGNDLLIVDWYGHDLAASGALGAYSKDRDEPQGLPLNMVSGRSGKPVWQVLSYAAPVDAAFMMASMDRNGLPDYDGDGVADLWIDDPLFLGDQTIIHRQVLISGRDTTPIFTIESPGAFSVPMRVADVTGDGLDDIALMNGDLSDLWLTIHNGTDGGALWSTRILSLAVTNYLTALPNLKIHPIADANATHNDFLVNYQLEVLGYGFFGFTQTLTPQILTFGGPNGSVGWAFPRAGGEEARVSLVPGVSPATALWLDASAPAQFSLRAETTAFAQAGGPAMVAFAAAFLSVFAGGALAMRTKRKKEEVPDLEDL